MVDFLNNSLNASLSSSIKAIPSDKIRFLLILRKQNEPAQIKKFLLAVDILSWEGLCSKISQLDSSKLLFYNVNLNTVFECF